MSDILVAADSGGVKKIFFGNSKKCSLEILANGLKIEKNRFEPLATYHGLATPQKIGRGGKMAIKSCYLITASRRDLIYSSKVAESSCFYEC